MLPLTLLVCSLLVTQGGAICTAYQGACTLLTGASCCGFPLALCLPDSRNGSSCLFPLDVANLSPSITALNPFAPLLGDLEDAARGIMNLFNPVTDPLANPLIDPLANPFIDPLANPLIDPLVNPIMDPLILG